MNRSKENVRCTIYTFIREKFVKNQGNNNKEISEIELQLALKRISLSKVVLEVGKKRWGKLAQRMILRRSDSGFFAWLRIVFGSRTLPASWGQVEAELGRAQILLPSYNTGPCCRCDRFERTLTRIMLVKLAASRGQPFRATPKKRARNCSI